MFIIADGGSTKCDWAIVGDKLQIAETEGINPYFCDSLQIEKILKKSLLPKIIGIKIDEVFFYGAGCRAEKCDVVKLALQAIFPYAKIEVESDLLGAARALFGKDSGIACILGTGSNSCLYDGKEIKKNVPPLGFILGDEGSGAVLGRKFLSDLLKNQMTKKLKQKFFNKYKLTISEIIEKTYCQPLANRFLAQFMPFLSTHICEPNIYNLVFDEFTEFIKKNIVQYAEYKEYKISFCGSVAYYFADVLKIAALEQNLNFGEIIQNPIEKLIEFHKNISKTARTLPKPPSQNR